MNLKPIVAVLAAIVIFAVPTGRGEASCGKSDRVHPDSAECLSASWSSSQGVVSVTSHVGATNMCPDWGTVVARIVLAGGEEGSLLTLDDGEKRSETLNSEVLGVYCCRDTSDLCNRSDLATDSGCFARFEDSAANSTCYDASAEVNADLECTIAAICRQTNGVGRSASITVPFLDADDLHNCNSVLQVGAC